MKRIIFSFISLLFSLSVFAQSGWVEDKTAQGVMEKLSKKLNNTVSLSADVLMITENKTSEAKDERKVNVLISDNKYRILFGNHEIYCNGILTWHYNKDVQEVTLSVADPSETEQLNLPKIISEWEKNYRAKLIREEENKGVIYQVIDLTPKKKQDYYKIRLIINKNKQEINTAQFHYFDGESVSYVFQSYKTNPKINPFDFTFDVSANPSVSVIDLR